MGTILKNQTNEACSALRRLLGPSEGRENFWEAVVKVGLQMYTVRNSFAKDPMGTLEKVAAAGYKYIEMANHKADQDSGTGFGTSAKELKAKADEIGIKII